MNRGLYPRDFVKRLYVPSKHGCKGLIAVEDRLNQARLSLERSSRCLHKHVFASHDNVITSSCSLFGEKARSHFLSYPSSTLQQPNIETTSKYGYSIIWKKKKFRPSEHAQKSCTGVFSQASVYPL